MSPAAMILGAMGPMSTVAFVIAIGAGIRRSERVWAWRSEGIL